MPAGWPSIEPAEDSFRAVQGNRAIRATIMINQGAAKPIAR